MPGLVVAQFDTDQIFRDNPLTEVIAARTGARIDADGKGEWRCLCPFHQEKTPSFTIHDSRDGKQRFHCFGCGVGGDVIEFVMAWEQCTFKEACERLGGKREWNPAAEREKSAPREVRDPYAGFKFRLPPLNAPELTAGARTPPLFNPKRADDGKPFTHYKPSMVFPYRTRDGRLIGYVLRVEVDGGKITPTIVWMERPDGQAGWCHGAMPEPRPPYRCEAIPRASADAQVIIVEGEKTADAAARLFPKALVLTWNGGSKAYDRTKWELIAGRNVVLWSDNDQQGWEAMVGRDRRGELIPGLAHILSALACPVRIVGLDPSMPDGWDLADAEGDGWTTQRAAEYAKSHARSWPFASDPEPDPEPRETRPAGGKPENPTQQIQTEQEKPEPNPKPKAAPRERKGNVTALPGSTIPQGVGVDRHNQWRERLQTNDEGKIRPKSFTNACLMVDHHPDYRGLFAFDQFATQIMVMREPPFGNPMGLNFPHPLTDGIVLNLRTHLERKGITLGTNEIGSAVVVSAQNTTINPLRDWLDGLKWDGTPRLAGDPGSGGWLAHYLGADPDPIHEAFGMRWMIAAVARAMEPGIKVDNMLILEGPQGLKKSTVFEVLGKVGQNNYFTDSISDVGSKDAVQQMQGHWIIEFAELEAMSRSDADGFKKFMTMKDDNIRLPYAKTTQKFPRSCIFAGTVNPIGDGYLKDPTGARRFWPVRVTSIDIPAIRRDRDQLFAEALHLFREGVQHWLTEEEEALAAEVQRKRLNVDPWARAIAGHVRGQQTAEVSDIIAELQIPRSQQTAITTKRIAGILRSIGFKRRVLSNGDIWVKEGSSHDQGDAE